MSGAERAFEDVECLLDLQQLKGAPSPPPVLLCLPDTRIGLTWRRCSVYQFSWLIECQG